VASVADGCAWCSLAQASPALPFIVDFASHRAKLVIEVDGGQHSEQRDAGRTAITEAEGYRVLRFWNNEVLDNAEGCARVLVSALAARSPPSNSG
jgi:very-short-patch-repair endonuclease